MGIDEQQKYESKLKELISKEIKSVMNEHDKAVIERHEDIMKVIASLEEKLKPVIKIYNNVEGMGNILSWLFKIIIVPTSVLIGVWISVKGVIQNHL